MLTIIEFHQEENYLSDFLTFPNQLYQPTFLTQKPAEEAALLKNKHPLSHYFKLRPFLVYDKQQVVGRFGLTFYPNSDTAYLGFFECINNPNVAQTIFKHAAKISRQQKCHKIIGPVDCSFWIGYRLKTNLFNRRPYFGEPYNLAYYPDFFKQAGFNFQHQYVSHLYRRPPLFTAHLTKKYQQRHQLFKSKNYKIISPKASDFDQTLTTIQTLIMKLYQDFPAFHPISLADYRKYFSNFRQISNLSLIKLAFYHDQAVGFFIGLPNYGTWLNQPLNFWSHLRISLQKFWSPSYVMLYMGVLPEHRGLGKALLKPIITQMYLRRAEAVGALIQNHKPTATYLEPHIKSEFTYSLLEKKL